MVRMAGKRRGGAVKNSPNPYHRARWEVQELRAFAALRNRRECQFRRIHKIFPIVRRVLAITSLSHSEKLNQHLIRVFCKHGARRQRRDGVRR